MVEVRSVEPSPVRLMRDCKLSANKYAHSKKKRLPLSIEREPYSCRLLNAGDNHSIVVRLSKRIVRLGCHIDRDSRYATWCSHVSHLLDSYSLAEHNAGHQKKCQCRVDPVSSESLPVK
jgi:hypothetical protein